MKQVRVIRNKGGRWEWEIRVGGRAVGRSALDYESREGAYRSMGQMMNAVREGIRIIEDAGA